MLNCKTFTAVHVLLTLLQVHEMFSPGRRVPLKPGLGHSVTCLAYCQDYMLLVSAFLGIYLKDKIACWCSLMLMVKGCKLEWLLFVLFLTEMFDLKVKYDESDHIMVRATRAFTDKMGQMFGEWHFQLSSHVDADSWAAGSAQRIV